MLRARILVLADQSHMTRHFSKTFGLTPGRWLQVARYMQRG